jgi:hypothetical protein
MSHKLHVISLLFCHRACIAGISTLQGKSRLNTDWSNKRQGSPHLHSGMCQSISEKRTVPERSYWWAKNATKGHCQRLGWWRVAVTIQKGWPNVRPLSSWHCGCSGQDNWMRSSWDASRSSCNIAVVSTLIVLGQSLYWTGNARQVSMDTRAEGESKPNFRRMSAVGYEEGRQLLHVQGVSCECRGR